MNPQFPCLPDEDDDAGWRQLAAALAQRAQPPAAVRDPWPALAARLAPAPVSTAPRSRRRRGLWFGAAAAALALLVAGRVFEAPAPLDPAAEVLLREAQALEREFDGAYRLLAQAPQPDAIRSAIDALERERRSILAALEQQPDSQRLFDQLRRTHELRLRLLLRGSALAA